MSEENNMEQLKLQKLGLFEKEIKQDVKSMSENIIVETIKTLDKMSLEEFNKLLLQPKNTIVDKKFTIMDRSKCASGDSETNCKNINIKFELLFRYIIGGYKTNDHIYNLDSLILDETNNRANRVYVGDKTLRRKAGIFHLTLDYYHHTTYCGNSYIGNTMNRTVWSLLVPNYETMISRGLEINDMLELFQQITDIRNNYEIKLDNLDEINASLLGEGCRVDHSEDYCNADCDDDEYCDSPHYEDNEEYCAERCENTGATNLISVMLTHPHFFNGMDNFCTGGQFSENKVLKELQQYPNPITYMAEMIRITNDVEFGDSYYSDRYMCDVFDNWNAFNEFDREVYRFKDLAKYYQANGRYSNSSESIFPTSEHTLSNNCYCVDCIVFRFWLKEGLKFDPTKLIMAEIGEITKEQIMNGMDRFEQDGNLNSDTKEIIVQLLDIDMTDNKYHVFDKSPFDQFNAGFRVKNFYLGIFNDKNGTPMLLNSPELRDMFKDYNHIHKMIKELDNLKGKSFPSEEFEKITNIIPLFKESVSTLSTFGIREYFEAMFTQILVT